MDIQQTIDQHEEVRTLVEAHYTDFKVACISCDSNTDYRPIKGDVDELGRMRYNPTLIPVLTKLRYRVKATRPPGALILECEVLWTEGKLEIVHTRMAGEYHGLL